MKTTAKTSSGCTQCGLASKGSAEGAQVSPADVLTARGRLCWLGMAGMPGALPAYDFRGGKGSGQRQHSSGWTVEVENCHLERSDPLRFEFLPSIQSILHTCSAHQMPYRGVMSQGCCVLALCNGQSQVGALGVLGELPALHLLCQVAGWPA